MKKVWLLLVLVCFGTFAQRPLSLVFDSIATDDSRPDERFFTLHYHITNETQNPVSFFLDTNSLVPVIASSMVAAPHYKLLKDGKSVDVASIFTQGQNFYRWKTQADYDKYVDSVKTEMLKPNYEQRSKAQRSDHYLKNIVRLQPGETKKYSTLLRWDYQRYQKQDEHEYFLDPDSHYQIELSMHLLLEEIEHRLLPEAYQKVLADETFIKGWFTSNRLNIDLRDRIK